MSGPRPLRWRLALSIALLGLAASALAVSPALSPSAAAAAGCVSATDCLSKMTLAEKAGQMTQVANTYITNKNDIATYGLGSILSGGGGGPNGAGGTPPHGPTWSTTTRATRSRAGSASPCCTAWTPCTGTTTCRAP